MRKNCLASSALRRARLARARAVALRWTGPPTVRLASSCEFIPFSHDFIALRLCAERRRDHDVSELPQYGVCAGLWRAIAQRVPVVATVGSPQSRRTGCVGWRCGRGLIGTTASSLFIRAKRGEPNRQRLTRPYVRSRCVAERSEGSLRHPRRRFAGAVDGWPGAAAQSDRGPGTHRCGRSGGQWRPYTGYGALGIVRVVLSRPLRCSSG